MNPMKRHLLSLLAAGLLLPALLHGQARDDQFKRDAFSQNYNDTTGKENADSTKLFSFRQYFGSLAHKRPGKVQNLAMGSTVFIGGMQIYNRQYWKLPVVYGVSAPALASASITTANTSPRATNSSSSTVPGPSSGRACSGGAP